ncbi:MAG TPA: tyrosine/phenylalanine carboxypeptidase domain-containing protein [Polyangiales bacterium]|nr:tyrosine/phenylalanine carboxypeptidase domain-containing protein [Polyangiales bacterium]
MDALVAHAAALARPVASLTPENAPAERARLIASLGRGETPVPAFTLARQRVDSWIHSVIDEARFLSRGSALGALYEARLDELELDLAILGAWGDEERVRPLSARRYGRGNELVRLGDSSELPLSRVARTMLDTLARNEPDPAVIPADAPAGRSVAAMMRRAALGAGLDVDVRVEPRLASLAATGERTVFLADRRFTQREARRLTAHEVFGHLVVAANARAQPLRLLQIGLAGSFSDQEGLALYLEEALGLMCNDRLRTLAARVVATVSLYDGASFGEIARSLVDQHGFAPAAAIAIAERTFRGGGVARDSGYLAGFLRVRSAIKTGDVTLDELRRGRVSLSAVKPLRALEAGGFVAPACYRPSLALSRKLTFGGTKADTSPPSDAASLTMLELT